SAVASRIASTRVHQWVGALSRRPCRYSQAVRAAQLLTGIYRMAGGPFEGMLMKIQFDDPLFEAWTQRPILTIAEGGAEVGEIKATAARFPEGDRDAWYREWTVTADRLYAQAEECAARGARISARYLYQRASTYYRNSYPLLFGRPI